MNYLTITTYILKKLKPIIGIGTAYRNEHTAISSIEVISIVPTKDPIIRLDEDHKLSINLAPMYDEYSYAPAFATHGYFIYGTLLHSIKESPDIVVYDLIRWSNPSVVIPNCGMIRLKVNTHVYTPKYNNS